MDTILKREMAGKEILQTEYPQSPRGKRNWKMIHLSSGEIAMVSPDTHGQIPRWVRACLTQQMTNFSIRRAGGTTFKWSGWMVRPEKKPATREGKLPPPLAPWVNTGGYAHPEEKPLWRKEEGLC